MINTRRDITSAKFGSELEPDGPRGPTGFGRSRRRRRIHRFLFLATDQTARQISGPRTGTPADGVVEKPEEAPIAHAVQGR